MKEKKTLRMKGTNSYAWKEKQLSTKEKSYAWKNKKLRMKEKQLSTKEKSYAWKNKKLRMNVCRTSCTLDHQLTLCCTCWKTMQTVWIAEQVFQDFECEFAQRLVQMASVNRSRIVSSSQTELLLAFHSSCITSPRSATFPDSLRDSMPFEHLTLMTWPSSSGVASSPTRSSLFARSQPHSTSQVCCCCHHDCCNHLCQHVLTTRESCVPAMVSWACLLDSAHPATTSNFKWPSAARLCNNKWRVCKCLRRPPIPRLLATLLAAELSLQIYIGT